MPRCANSPGTIGVFHSTEMRIVAVIHIIDVLQRQRQKVNVLELRNDLDGIA